MQLVDLCTLVKLFNGNKIKMNNTLFTVSESIVLHNFITDIGEKG